ELRARPPAGRRPGDPDRPGAEDSGRRDALEAPPVGAGEGWETAGQDHVPARRLHLPGRPGGRPRPRGQFDRQGAALDPTDRMAAGFARGFGFALRVAIACDLALTIPFWLLSSAARDVRIQDSAQWSAELVLVALVAGYARRVFGEAEVRHSLALDRISRLAEA